MLVPGLLLLVAGLTIKIVHASGSSPSAGLVADRAEIVPRGADLDRSLETGSGRATAIFHLVNRDVRPIRVTSVETSCGCTSARIEPKTIAPGAAADLEVKSNPPPVGEAASAIRVSTDSSITPVVPLVLRVIGSRPPPFQLDVSGPLTYAGAFGGDETREIKARTVEMKGSAHQPPLIVSGAPFLVIDPPSVQESSYFDPETVLREYVYKVRFRDGKLPSGLVSAEIEVVDPWDGSFKRRILVQGDSPRPLRVYPSRLRLVADGAADAGGRAVLTVVLADSAGKLSVEPELNGPARLLVRPRPPTTDDPNRLLFEIALDPRGSNKDGESAVVVRIVGSKEPPVRVPVRIVVNHS